jgi:hypothetical protein
MLEQCQRDANKSSGIDALRFLQNYCWLQDDYQRNQTSAMFQALVIGTDESIARFNNRFVRMLASARVAGLDYTQGELVDHYLQAALPIRDPDLKFQVRFWLNTCSQEKLADKPTELTVMAMQSELQREEQKVRQAEAQARNQPRFQKTNNTRDDSNAMQASAQENNQETKQNTAASAAKTLSQMPTQNVARTNQNRRQPQNNRATNQANQRTSRNGKPIIIKCYGCQSSQHLLKDCPVTSQAQKKVLYKEMKARYRATKYTSSTAMLTHASNPSPQHSQASSNMQSSTNRQSVASNAS